MRPRQLLLVATTVVAGLAGSLLPVPAGTPTAAATPAVTSPGATRMPGEIPSRRTPWVLDGEVTEIVQVGDVLVAGGTFTRVSDPMDGRRYTRRNLFAFDATTGMVSRTFAPTLDGAVQQLLPGPTDHTVYVAGDFTKVNRKGPPHLQLLDVDTGVAVPSFRAPATNGSIRTLELLPGNRLFVGGSFTKVGGARHGQLASLDATTGAPSPFLDLTVAGRHNTTGSGAKGSVGARASGVTPDGDRLVVIGNFRTVAGHRRDQVVMIDLTGTRAAVATTWATRQYAPICSPRAFDSYLRDVEMAPDGSFFVVAATGGHHRGTLCDTAARFETYARGTAQTATWTSASGGDTLWGVEITRAAVYVGGHNRWMNNPGGANRAAQGAVPRPGLAALDPENGIPLRWNPGRNPRGEAAYEIHETDTGVWVVSDTDWIGNRRYRRPRIAFFPYDEGTETAAKTTGSLPGHVYVGAPVAASNVLYRVNAGGPAIPSTDAGPDWAADTATTSAVRTTGSTAFARSPLGPRDLVGVPASTPAAVWTSERADPAGGNEMRWSFPVPAGSTTEVRLYLASRSTALRRFTVQIDGVARLPGYDPNSDPGPDRGTMKTFDVTSDGTVNVDFLHVTGDPEVNAVEILDTAAAPNGATAAVLGFDGSSVTSRSTVSTGSFDWSTVRGAVMIGDTLFYGQSDGFLYRRSFDGARFGDPVAVDPYRDPLWSAVRTGSGPPGQTYTGALPSWYRQLASVTGMFYDHGRIYYTRAGRDALHWRWFSPDSGIVGGVEKTVRGSDIRWGDARGMFLDGSTLYVVDGADGRLVRTGFSGGVPRGPSSVADATTDWRGRAVFLASVPANVAPSAAFSSACGGTTCAFDGSASTDVDGTVEDWAWDFGDGTTGSGVTTEHHYDRPGTYVVRLVVTDEDGATAESVSEQQVVDGPSTTAGQRTNFIPIGEERPATATYVVRDPEEVDPSCPPTSCRSCATSSRSPSSSRSTSGGTSDATWCSPTSHSTSASSA